MIPYDSSHHETEPGIIYVLVELTQEDIDQGCRQNGDNCPWQRAISRHVKPVEIEVNQGSHDTGFFLIDLDRGYTVNSRSLPNSAPQGAWIDRYDGDLPVHPIKAFVSIPNWAYQAPALTKKGA